MQTQDSHRLTENPAPKGSKPANALKGSVELAVRQTLAIIGLLLIIVAIPIGFLTPLIPIGLPLAIVGVILLGRNAKWGRIGMEKLMERHTSLERFAPNWLMRLVFGRDKRDVPPV